MQTTVQTASRPLGAAAGFMRHLLCLLIPVWSVAFVFSGPHRWWVAIASAVVLPATVWIDGRARPARHAPPEKPSRAAGDMLLVVLSVLHVIAMVGYCELVTRAGPGSWDALVGLLLVGTNAGYSAIVVAHELIHRRSKLQRTLGRLLLVTVLYEHFYTEHIRGHHARVATPDDPASARFGERFEAFFRRTVRAQFVSAWQLECRRLGDATMRLWDVRQRRNRVLHGIAAQVAMLVAVGAVWGWQGLVAWVAVAVSGIRLLEAVNYFEHWGLARAGKKVTTVDSWDAESWFTLYSLVGLSRHADHHAHASRPFQQLRHFDESPKLPRGYFGMVTMVLINDRRAIKLLTRELRRRRLGPYAESNQPVRQAA